MKDRNTIEQEIINKAAEDEAFLEQLKQDPQKVIAEFLPDDVEIPEGVSVKVMQESPTELILRLPFELSDNEELSADELDAVSAGGYGDAIKSGVNSDINIIKSGVTLQNPLNTGKDCAKDYINNLK